MFGSQSGCGGVRQRLGEVLSGQKIGRDKGNLARAGFLPERFKQALFIWLKGRRAPERNVRAHNGGAGSGLWPRRAGLGERGNSGLPADPLPFVCQARVQLTWECPAGAWEAGCLCKQLESRVSMRPATCIPSNAIFPQTLAQQNGL